MPTQPGHITLSKIKLSTFILLVSIVFMAGLTFIYSGIDYVKVECEKNTCTVSPQALGLFNLESRSINNVTEIFLDSKPQQTKSGTVIALNIILTNSENESITVFDRYSNGNKEDREFAYEDLKKAIATGETVNKTYGGLTAGLGVGIIVFLLPIPLIRFRIKNPQLREQ